MIRLFVTDDLAAGRSLILAQGQIHYLIDVMRLGDGEEILAFNGRDGEWRARLAQTGKRAWSLKPASLERGQAIAPDLELLIALIKRPRLETVVEKAAELGARRVRLVITDRSGPGRPRLDRLGAIAAEAAEQTGRMEVPDILAAEPLVTILAGWSGERRLLFCDEAGDAPPLLEAMKGAAPGPWAILIGSEGGFSAAERATIRACPGAMPVGLGPRILRAETAAIAAMSLWQAVLGDWPGDLSFPPPSPT